MTCDADIVKGYTWLCFKVSMYLKNDHYKEKDILVFSDRSHLDLSFQKNAWKKIVSTQSYEQKLLIAANRLSKGARRDNRCVIITVIGFRRVALDI